MEIDLNNLEKIRSIVITTNGLIGKASEILQKHFNNIIYINKPNILIKYRLLTVTIGNDSITLDLSSTREDIEKVNRVINRADRVSITPINSNTSLEYDRASIHGVQGLNLLCHKELAIEYMKSLVYEILYHDSELLFLCRKNPTINNDVIDTVDILEVLGVSTSPFITDEEVSDITLYISKALQAEYDEYIKSIRSIAREFKKHPKAIKISSRSIIIDIYSDIRIIRFYEMTEYLKDIERAKKEKEGYNSYVEEDYDKTICNNGYY